MNYLGFFIGGMIMFLAEFYVWSRFYNEKINFGNPWLYFSIFLLLLVGMFNHIFINAFIKVVFITILMCLCNWLIFRKHVNEIIVNVFIRYCLLTYLVDKYMSGDYH